MFDVPVLLIAFNRKSELLKVFQVVRDIQPKKLYLAVDGPRIGFESDLERVNEVRAIADLVDWDCEVNTKHSEHNLGCKLGVVGAINWLFENEVKGIILEDDCVPDPSFFSFCKDMLLKYEDNPSILQIGGTNPLATTNESSGYYFSKYNRIWGWATWRRAWEHNDVEIKEWPSIKADRVLYDIFCAKEAIVWERIFDNVYAGKIDTWDYQWFLSKLLKGFTVIPYVNLISNIGFGKNATHTFNEESYLANLPQGKYISGKEKKQFYLHNRFDSAWSEKIIGEDVSKISRLFQKVKRKLVQIKGFNR